uniref:type VI secretion system Vgr family protein n=2 Tax=Weeksellaceae TaxID=2762318 RepID=UPI0039A5E575
MPNNPLNNLDHPLHIKTYQDFLADVNNPVVMPTLYIGGKPFLEREHFRVEIHQYTGKHDEFTIIVSDEVVDDFYGFLMRQSRLLLGEQFLLNFHQYGKVIQSFQGIVTQVSNKKNGDSGTGDLYITASAPSILLENGKNSRSFEKMTVEQIIAEVCKNYPPEAKVKVIGGLNTKNSLDYTVQYNESDYAFLTRLANRLGEYFYYDGKQLIFGNRAQKQITLSEGDDLAEVSFDLKIQNQNFTQYVYDEAFGDVFTHNADNAFTPPKDNPILGTAIQLAKKTFTQKSSHYSSNFTMGDEDSDARYKVPLYKEKLQHMMWVKGKSRNPLLKSGSLADMYDINGKAMEIYRILEITHHLDGDTYWNEFVGIPDIFVSPYVDENAFAKCEDQPAIVKDNNDPQGLGRVRVQFIWQRPTNEYSPWIRVVQPHGGSGKGFYFIPEIDEEVMVSFENQNAERPYVIGSHYNGKSKSGYATKDNSVKVIKTRSNHTILLDDSKEKMSITIVDQAGNTIYLDTVNKSIQIEAPETISIKCKNLDIEVAENMKTSVGQNQESTIGKNLKIVAQEEISQDSGKKTIIASGDNTEISAKRDLDLYGKQNLIGYTDGKSELGAKEQMHVYGTKSLITAKDKIEYKAPSMNKLPQKGEFKYDKEKKIINAQWMCSEFKTPVKTAQYNEKLSLLVQTRNYEEGETITIVVGELNDKDINEQGKEITLSGTVDNRGFAELREKVEVLQETEAEKQLAEQEKQKEQEKLNNEIYKTYEGKDYTYNEWKIKEQELWEEYKRNKTRK